MARSLPQHWLDGTRKSLSVSRDLGLRGDYPSTLSVYVVGKTKNLAWRFLPDEAEDPRPFCGRTNNGKGKRKYIEGTTGTDDPWEAGKAAISASIARRKALLRQIEDQSLEREHALSNFWETWIARVATEPRSNQTRWMRDKKLLWSGTNGIGLQPWATQKSVSRITFQDFQEFFSLVTKHCQSKGTSGNESKRQYKTLIRNLFDEARVVFPSLQCPDFPKISKQIKQVKHLTHDEWDMLVEKLVQLSGGAARENLTPQEYLELDWSPRNKKNQRNWVDLYDAIHLQWFYYLRSEDAPRLRSEWFTDKGDVVLCYLEKTKGDRDLHNTTAYRPDAYENIKRTLKRKPKGYLVFPWIPRKDGSENESNVGETLNDLIRAVLEACGLSTDEINWKTFRHTAFRLTLEEFPRLGEVPDIASFAINGHTSETMLRERYLKFIDADKVSKAAREAIKPGKWSMQNRVTM